MPKGEIIAVSPKGRGMHPKSVTVLLRNDEGEDWIPVDDSVEFKGIKKGMCEFELTNENKIKRIISDSKQESLFGDEVPEGHTFPLKELDIIKLSLEINKLNQKRKIAATQVFPIKNSEKQLYDALVYFKSSK